MDIDRQKRSPKSRQQKGRIPNPNPNPKPQSQSQQKVHQKSKITKNKGESNVRVTVVNERAAKRQEKQRRENSISAKIYSHLQKMSPVQAQSKNSGGILFP